MAEEWITTTEAAQLIDVTVAHINHLLRDEKIKGKKFGRFWMVERASAEAYAAKNRKPGPKPKTD